MAITATSEYAN